MANANPSRPGRTVAVKATDKPGKTVLRNSEGQPIVVSIDHNGNIHSRVIHEDQVPTQGQFAEDVPSSMGGTKE